MVWSGVEFSPRVMFVETVDVTVEARIVEEEEEGSFIGSRTRRCKMQATKYQP